MSEDQETSTATRRPIFSDAVDQLARFEPPDDATLRELLRALRAALVLDLKRRGVWQAPPSYLGILGPSWTANDSEALDELTQDAYLYIFVRRLGTLIKLRKAENDAGEPGDAGPLVLKMVRQLISDLQRRADPVGHCVYSRLNKAALQLIKAGKLHGQLGDRWVNNRTVLSFEGGQDVTPVGGEVLAELAITWNEALLPELITALGKAEKPLIDNLRVRLMSLREAGVSAFRFGEVVAPLKRDVRRRWGAVWVVARGGCTDEGNGTAEAVPIAWPRNPVEYESLLDCVNSSIDRHRPGGEQGSLWYLWLVARGVHTIGDEPRRVSVARVANLLEVSRRQVGKLLKALQGMASGCLSALEMPNKHVHDPEDDAPRVKSAGR